MEHGNEASSSTLSLFLLQYPTSAKFYLAKFYGVPFKPISRIQDVVITDQDVSYRHGNSVGSVSG